jgi:DNA topoisomerase-1
MKVVGVFVRFSLRRFNDDEEEQEGMFIMMKVAETYKKIISPLPKDIQDLQHAILKLLWLKLEELGIGRPSTYAPTISTIINRNYVEKGNLDGQERKYTQLTLLWKSGREAIERALIKGS